jgi:REP-associated tyrosine transposase
MNYRRLYIPGATHFFTVNLLDRTSDLLTQNIDKLRLAFAKVKVKFPFTIDAIVILPDHIHAIFTLPNGDTDYSTRWRLIKYHFSYQFTRYEPISAARERKLERGIWQRRFWEHTIRNQNDFNRHVDYIHYNPVKHGYVNNAADWPHSSLHRFKGNQTPSWDLNTSARFDDQNFGE